MIWPQSSCELSYLLHRRRLDGGGRGPGRDQPRPAAAADGRLLLALQAVPHRARAHEAQALPEKIKRSKLLTLIIIIHAIKSIPEDAARGHVLLGLEVGKVEAGGEDEYVGHHDEALQERHRHLDRHPLRRLQHVKLVLQSQGVNLNMVLDGEHAILPWDMNHRNRDC